MRKRVILAFMLVFALVAASSCSLIIKDEEVDKQTPIIEVAGRKMCIRDRRETCPSKA